MSIGGAHCRGVVVRLSTTRYVSYQWGRADLYISVIRLVCLGDKLGGGYHSTRFKSYPIRIIVCILILTGLV